jgi:heme oxygenase
VTHVAKAPTIVNCQLDARAWATGTMADGDGVPVDFSTELRERARQSHSLSHSAVNLTAPIALSSPLVYRLLVKQFYFVFMSMEMEMERLRRNFPKVSNIYFRELLRTAAFEQDLAFYYGVSWRDTMGPPSPATVKYIAEMQSAVAKNPLLIISFCQVSLLPSLPPLSAT